MKSLKTMTAVIALAMLPTFALAASPAAKKPARTETTGIGGNNVSTETVGSIRSETDGTSSQTRELRRDPTRELTCALDALGKSMCEEIRR